VDLNNKDAEFVKVGWPSVRGGEHRSAAAASSAACQLPLPTLWPGLPSWQVYQSINPDPAASAKVPILVDEDGTKLIESQLVVDYLEQRYPQPRLLPEDPVAAYRARLWVDAFSSQFTPAIFALLRAADADGVAAGKAKLEAALTVGQGVKGAGPGLRRCAGAQR
jgi:hypothetical protein